MHPKIQTFKIAETSYSKKTILSSQIKIFLLLISFYMSKVIHKLLMMYANVEINGSSDCLVRVHKGSYFQLVNKQVEKD